MHRCSSVTDDSVTPLHLAAFSGSVECVRALLECGADIETTTTRNQRPIHYAALRGRVTTLEYLLDRGADATTVDDDEMLPPHWACVKGESAVVRALVQRHSSTATQRDVNRWLPLHLTCSSDHLDMIGILLEACLQSVHSTTGEDDNV